MVCRLGLSVVDRARPTTRPPVRVRRNELRRRLRQPASISMVSQSRWLKIVAMDREGRQKIAACGKDFLRFCHCLAGGPGFEPGLTESESAVLPLNYPPIQRRRWRRRRDSNPRCPCGHAAFRMQCIQTLCTSPSGAHPFERGRVWRQHRSFAPAGSM